MKYLIYPLLLFLLVISNQYSFSQEKTTDSIIIQNSSGKITGRVYGDLTRLSLTNVSVKIISLIDSAIFKGTETDSTGNFRFKDLGYGSYKLMVFVAGYSEYIKSPVIFDSINNNIILDTIMLITNSPVTEEIDVEGEKGLMQFGPDKKIFNAEKSVITKGDNALDLLKKVPLVSVDENDNVKMRGRIAKILIDGKEPTFYSNLKQLPADLIKTVELITNPSAKYESENVSGIINIVLKERTGIGINGNIYLSATSRDNYSGNFSFNIKRGPVTFFSSYNCYYGRGAYNTSISRENLLTPISYMEQSTIGSNKNQSHNISFGMEYEINKIHTINFEGTYMPVSKYDGTDRNYMNNFDSLRLHTSSTNRINIVNGKDNRYRFSLDYTGKLDTNERELTAYITVNNYSREFTNKLNQQNYDSILNPVYFPLRQIDKSKSKNFNLSSNINYFHPFTKETSLESGIKTVFRMNDNDLNSDTLNNAINQYQTNTINSNHFKYTEQIYSLYGVYGSKIKNLSFKVGFKIEQTVTKGELLTTGEEYKNSYLSYFPSINLSYMLPGMQQIQASYSRRIRRPGSWLVNPFKRQWDPYNFFVGNPYIKPEFTDSYQLGYMLYWKQISITPEAFFYCTHDVTQQYSYLTNGNVTVTTYNNLSSSKSYGLDIMTNSQIFPWWYLNGTLSFYQLALEGAGMENYVSDKDFTWSANLSTYFNFPKVINIQLYYMYSGKHINAQGETKAHQMFNFGINKSFFENKLWISLSANDPFQLEKYDSYISGTGFKQTYLSDYDSRTVYLGISYMFGKQEQPKKKRNKENSIQDQNNEGSDGLK